MNLSRLSVFLLEVLFFMWVADGKKDASSIMSFSDIYTIPRLHLVSNELMTSCAVYLRMPTSVLAQVNRLMLFFFNHRQLNVNLSILR